MTTIELIRSTAQITGLTQAHTKLTIRAAIDIILANLDRNEPTQIGNVGTFYMLHKAAHETYSPQDDAIVMVSERYIPKFKYNFNLVRRLRAKYTVKGAKKLPRPANAPQRKAVQV